MEKPFEGKQAMQRNVEEEKKRSDYFKEIEENKAYIERQKERARQWHLAEADNQEISF